MSGSPCPHWQAELERVRAECPTLAPAVRTAVLAVLESVVAEDATGRSEADPTRSLLVALTRQAHAEPRARVCPSGDTRAGVRPRLLAQSGILRFARLST